MRCEPIRTFFIVLLALGWSATVLAAQAAPNTLSDLPWAQVGIGGCLALWGGLTRTAERALDAIKGQKPFLLVQELAKDILVSSGIGFLVYATGAAQGWNVWVLGASLWTAGYIGSRVLTRYTGPWLDKKMDQVSRRGDL